MIRKAVINTLYALIVLINLLIAIPVVILFVLTLTVEGMKDE